MTEGKKANSAGVGMRRGGDGLYLPSPVMEGFRGFKRLEIPELGQVALLVGANCAGKSTVLEAIHLHAGAGSFRTVRRMLRERENVLERAGMEEDDSSAGLGCGRSIGEPGGLNPDLGSLFHTLRGKTVDGDANVNDCILH